MIKQTLIFVLLFAPMSVTNAIYTEEQYRHDQVMCLAKNIYFEGRGEPLVGQIIIGQVVLNRTKSQKFPSTVCEVVFQGKYRNATPIYNQCQFSWWCDGRKEEIEEQEFEKSYELASSIYDHEITDLSEGALYYHATRVRPYWAKSKKRILSIENHVFYK